MSSNKQPVNMGVRIVKAAAQPITKAEVSTQVTEQEAYNAGDWITPPLDLRGLRTLVKNSSILPQCIRAYKNNIAGFGIGVRYKDDIEETEEMAAEFNKAEEIIELLNLEQDTKEVFEDIIEAREIYGISYVEVIRNVAGEVQQIEFIKDTPSITKTKPLDPYVPTPFYHHGEVVERRKRYCKYRQQIGDKTVYFKEFGDPRIMDNRDGLYVPEGETLEIDYHANEIIEFAIGTEPYGEVRWIGQILGVDGSRKAEGLNNNYFENGRHTPLMIMIKGGTLTDESFEKLQQYMNDIKGEAGQHAFIILETESNEGRVDFDQSDKPEIEIKDLANILQKDELFQDYLDNNRRKVQSAFQLPDLYVGYTTDFNRATAQTAQEVTEEQVFQPERKSLAWAVNNKLLNGYQFQYVEAYFLEPDISNPDDLYKLLTVANNAGGLTPNKAKQIVYEAFGETAEDYPEEWGDVPLAYSKTQSSGTSFDLGQLTMSLQKQIEKAAGNHDDAVVAIMKEVKSLLKKMDKGE
ncbi:MAG: phage portal protein [Ruminococcus sp.]|nr:phage portal protein [Ruminococcus sp.]